MLLCYDIGSLDMIWHNYMIFLKSVHLHNYVVGIYLNTQADAKLSQQTDIPTCEGHMYS